MDSYGKETIEIIREVFTYINRFRDKAFVIKIDSEVIENLYFPVLLKDLATLHNAGIKVIIVPGARKRIDEILEKYGIETEYSGGIRITEEGTIPFVKMAAFDVSNKIMTGLSAYRLNALVGNWVRARSMGVINGVDFKYTGNIDKILTTPLNKVLNENFVPIIPSIGWNPAGTPYNLSANELTIQVASAMNAEKIFFITSEDMLNISDYRIPSGVVPSSDGRISRMDGDAAQKFLALNSGGNSRSLEIIKQAISGIRNGIKRVHIINGNGNSGILSEIFSNLGIGTMIYRNEFDRIRKMVSGDIPEVLRIMRPFERSGALIPRTKADLQHSVGDYVVYEIDNVVHGCAALHQYEGNVGEIAAVAVDPEYERMGIGKKLITYLIMKAQESGMKSLFLLTTRSVDWFELLGFKSGRIEDLPGQKKENYNVNRNSRVMILKLEEFRQQPPDQY